MTPAMNALAAALLAIGCRDDGRGDTARAASSGALEGARLASRTAQVDDGEWRMPARDYASTRFAPIDQITSKNVKDLRLAWTFTTGIARGHEAAPLVVGDTMYVITPFPNRLHALDVVSGQLRWTYDPRPDSAAQGVACCDVVNRGGAYWDGRIYYATLDGNALAVDAVTGREVWKTKLGDINRGETITMAPIVVKGKVLVGNSGGELGVRGWLTALDAVTGAVVWRAYSTGPDSDVLIGPRFAPHYASDRGVDLGVKTWPPDRWRQGGGTVWGWISYDPELDLIYYGTSNPGPWNADMRPGDNKWTAGVFARDPDTGEAIWFYQWSPHDLYDFDGVNENVLLDLEIGGRPRKVLVHPERNGYVYVLDRATGEVLSADPFVHITASRGVDLESGRMIENTDKRPRLGQVTRDICPASVGGKDWSPSAFSPLTGLLYMPHNNMCMSFEPVDVGYIAGTPYVGAEVSMVAGPGGNRGELTAWDPIARKKAWSVKEKFPAWGGALATGGGVVFYGSMEGDFKALDARSGAELWRYHMPSGIVGQPVTYRAPDGKQYVAVLAGVGGWAGVVVSAEVDTRDETAALGIAAATRDLPQYTTKGGTLFVFSL